jgi:hypothetical protein
MGEKMEVRKWGERMNSPYPRRRNLYLVIEPEPIKESILETIKSAAFELKNLLVYWDFDSGSQWWVNHRECSACRARQQYEISIASEWVWQRHFCMRHYLVSHLSEISHENIESNRCIEFSISERQITLKLATNNYDYDITILRDHAVVSLLYKKDKKYTFTYRNHTNALPYASTFLLLLRAVIDVISKVRRFLAFLAYDTNACYAYNIYVNNVLVLEAQDDQQCQ